MSDNIFLAFWEIATAYPAVISVFGIACGFVGILIGNWLALERDRRKERIEVAQRIRELLLKARSDPRPVWPGISVIDNDLMFRMLPIRKRRGFRQAADNYRKHQTDYIQDASGQVFFRSPDAVAAAIDRLLPYTSKR